MASAVSARLPRPEAAEPPRQPAALAEDLLQEIFLRIASPADLARASTACVSFRRLITDPSFLRRYRSLHPPLLLGFLRRTSGSFHFQPAEAPHPSAPAARAIDRASNFPIDDYVPRGGGCRWRLCDVREGRVLLKSSPDVFVAFPELAVCDPLSRRYLLLPPLPDRLVASVQHWPLEYRCFYWRVSQTNKLLELDVNRMEFSTVDFRANHDVRSIVVVEAGEGRIGIFIKVYQGTPVYYFTIMQNEGKRSNELQLQCVIPLSSDFNYCTSGASEGYIFLVGVSKS